MYSQRMYGVGSDPHKEWYVRGMLCNYLADWVADNLCLHQRPASETFGKRLQRSLQLVSEHFALGKQIFPDELRDPFFTYQRYDNPDLSGRLVSGGYNDFQRQVNACLSFFDDADLCNLRQITIRDATHDLLAYDVNKLSELEKSLRGQGLSSVATQNAIIGFALRNACVGGFSYDIPAMLSGPWTSMMRDFLDSLCTQKNRLCARLQEEYEEPEVHALIRAPALCVTKLPSTHWAGDPELEYPMKDIAEAITYINRNRFNGQRPETAGVRDDFDAQDMPAPNGLHVFQSLFDDRQVRVCIEKLGKLFRIIEGKEPASAGIKQGDKRFQRRDFLGPAKSNNNILFIAKGGGDQQPKYRECMRHILAYDKKLHDFIEKYANFYRRITGAGETDFERCQLQLVHYFPGKGLNAHIDSISAFGNTLGPIFTINMNLQKKGFDLYPTLKQAGTPVLRLFTNMGETTMMDGESRILWSHGIPTGSQNDNYTIAFKFACLDRYRDDCSGGRVNIIIEDRNGPIPQRLLTMDIPQNLALEYRTPNHDEYKQQVVPDGIPLYVYAPDEENDADTDQQIIEPQAGKSAPVPSAWGKPAPPAPSAWGKPAPPAPSAWRKPP